MNNTMLGFSPDCHIETYKYEHNSEHLHHCRNFNDGLTDDPA